MPLQNRVDPFGTVHAISARGTMMGNRGGRIHDPATKTLNRRYASKRWIACVCAFRGRRREVMGQYYTELFFLDEVTAFAAGHRPCAECRRADFVRFADAWREVFGATARRVADAMDSALHGERCVSGKGLRLKLQDQSDACALPDGAMVSTAGQSFAIHNGRLLPWSFDGYGPPLVVTDDLTLLTPPSIVKILQSGYVPGFHSSADL